MMMMMMMMMMIVIVIVIVIVITFNVAMARPDTHWPLNSRNNGDHQLLSLCN